MSDIIGRGEPPVLLSCGYCFFDRHPGLCCLKKTGFNRYGGVLSINWGKKMFDKFLVLWADYLSILVILPKDPRLKLYTPPYGLYPSE